MLLRFSGMGPPNIQNNADPGESLPRLQSTNCRIQFPVAPTPKYPISSIGKIPTLFKVATSVIRRVEGYVLP
jgi:hypothetical protein